MATRVRLGLSHEPAARTDFIQGSRAGLAAAAIDSTRSLTVMSHSPFWLRLRNGQPRLTQLHGRVTRNQGCNARSHKARRVLTSWPTIEAEPVSPGDA